MDYFHNLSPELRGIVCSLVGPGSVFFRNIVANSAEISKSDLKSLRVGNKEWSTAAVTELWREVTLNLEETTSRDLHALLFPIVNGALDNIKCMTVKHTSGTYHGP